METAKTFAKYAAGGALFCYLVSNYTSPSTARMFGLTYVGKPQTATS